MFLVADLFNAAQTATLADLIDKLKAAAHTNKNKNVDILHLASLICRKMKGTFFNE